jgi:hypothetical protein
VDIKRFVAAGRKAWDRAADVVLAVGLFAACLALYLRTMAPSIATLFDDSLEFPLVSHRLGIAHPTGYPLYTLLGKLFTLGPWRNVGWSVNLLSVVAGALTVVLVYLIGRKLVRRRWPPLLGAVALAVSPVFWSQSVIAEVYSLNSALVAALLWLALRWARQPLAPVRPFSLLQVVPRRRPMLYLPGQGGWSRMPPVVRRAAHRLHTVYRRLYAAVPPSRRLQLHPRIYALALLFGLGLAHHRSLLMLVPALFIYVLLVEPRVLSRAALLGPEHPDRPRWLQLAGRSIVLLLIAFLVPLLLYLYLPLRGNVGSLDGTYANTWRGFWQWVLASGYSVFLGDNVLARDLDAAFYGRLFWEQFGAIGLALALVGILALAFRRNGQAHRLKALALTGLAFLAYVAFALLYRVPDVEVFFIPAFLIAAVWIGVGLDYAASLLAPRGRSLGVRRLLAVCGALLLLAAVIQPLGIAIRNYPDLDLSQRWAVHDYGLYVLEQPLPADSTIVGLGGEMNLLRYFQDTIGRRSGLETIIADDEAARLDQVRAALDRGRAVYITRPLPGISEEYSLSAVLGTVDVAGDLETLMSVAEPLYDPPQLPNEVNLSPVPGLELLGYGLREHQAHSEAWVRLRLWWRAPEGLEEPFKISARLIDAGGQGLAAGGQVVASVDAEPVAAAYPAPAWRPGEVVADAYEIPLPAGLPPGEYMPLIIVYQPDTGAELGRVELPPVALQGNPARPPRRALEASVRQTAYARFGDVELLGFTPPDPTAVYSPGGTLPLTLLWQARGQPSGDLRVTFWLEGAGAHALGEEPVGGRFPASAWQDGQVVRQWPLLRLPDDTPAGAYRLRMRVTRDGQPVPWGRGLLPLGSDLELGEVWIER